MQSALSDLLGRPELAQPGGIALLLAVCLLAHLATRRFVVRAIEGMVARSRAEWDDVLHESHVFARAVPLVPAVIAWYGIQLVPSLSEPVELVFRRVVVATIILVVSRALAAFLSAANELYTRNPENRSRPIKGYIQVLKIVIGLVATVLILATLMDRSPAIFLSGIGAMTAVILLIFRDTILSLVASVQLTGNDMIRVGDWIEMPQYGADGDVIDIALHTVKVQNWDKTITTIPTHKLISDSFRNWRGMSLSGGRRIKRALYIDAASVRFLEEAEIDRVGEFSLLRDYIRRKREEIRSWNLSGDRNPELDADIRRLTNLGTFRAYLEHYLRSHRRIHQGMTLMVRQLAPGPTGIPLEVYCFTNTTSWIEYEGIQADLFEHFFAIAREFDLRIFQSPSGADLLQLRGGAAVPLDARTSY